MRPILTATALGFVIGTCIAGWVMGVFIGCAFGVVASVGVIVFAGQLARRH